MAYPVYTKLKDAMADQNIVKAIKNTERVEANDGGIKFSLSRFQKPEQCGMESVRLGVFWLPEPNSPWKRYYSTGQLSAGQFIEDHQDLQKYLI